MAGAAAAPALSRPTALVRLFHYLALPAILLALLAAVISLSPSQAAASVGSGFGTKIIAGSSGTSGTETLSYLQFSQAAVQFSAALSPAIGRTTVAVVVQEAHTGSITTVGTLRSLATRVFSSQPTPLPQVFSLLHPAARPGTTYAIAVTSGSATLTSTTFTLTA